MLALVVPKLSTADFVVMWDESGTPRAQTFPDQASADRFMAQNSGFNFTTPKPVETPPAGGNNSANNGQLYPSPLTGQLVSAEQYNRDVAQMRQQQRQQQIQQNIKEQLNRASGGGGGGGSGGGGGGGSGGGGGKGGGGNSNSLQPLNASAFGQTPDFSKGNSELEKLIAQSQKPDAESEKLLEDLKKRAAEVSQVPNSDLKWGSLPDFNALFLETIAALQALPSTLSAPEQLMRNAQLAPRRRKASRPLLVPSGRGLVAGQSDPYLVGGRGLASIAAGTTKKTAVGTEFLLEPKTSKSSASKTHRK